MPITDFDKVELLLPMTGANNGTTFTDASLRQRAVTRTGSVTSTAQSKFASYGSSGLFTRTVGHCVAPGLGVSNSQSWTLEAWVRPNTADVVRSLAGYFENLAGRWYFGLSAANKLVLWCSPNSTSGTTDVSINEWYHLALCRADRTRGFLNGVKEIDIANPTFLTGSMVIGAYNLGSSNESMAGNINDLCFTLGVGKYTADFTPPLRMTQRTLTRTNTGSDSHEYDRAVLFDWNGSQNTLGHTGGGFVVPDSEGDFVETGLNDLEYGVAFIKDGCGPICRGPVEVDPDA
jgi:hypothetical protein